MMWILDISSNMYIFELVYYKWDLNVCDDGILLQVLSFWTLSIVLSMDKNLILVIVYYILTAI
jgi:hypothetical protein